VASDHDAPGGQPPDENAGATSPPPPDGGAPINQLPPQPPGSGGWQPPNLPPPPAPGGGPIPDQPRRPRRGGSGPPGSRGNVRRQDRATSRKRAPSVGEARARDKVRQKEEAIEQARVDAEEKRRKRNRRLIGAAATVGVVGVVAGLGYWALSPNRVTAQCVQDDPSGHPVIVEDSYCTTHSSGPGGFIFFGGHQYRYYYGSTGAIGTWPVGGTTVAPKGSEVKTKSGTTVQRGGFGSKFYGGGS
jgi:hypothetical protein